MSRARSSSSAGVPETTGPPLPPLTNNDFFSAIATLSVITSSQADPQTRRHFFESMNAARTQSEDRQIQRNQHTPHEYRHDQEDRRLDQCHSRPQRRLHVLFVKFRYRTQHCRQCSGGFTDLNHFYSHVGEDLLFLQAFCQSLALAHTVAGLPHSVQDSTAAHRSACSLHGWNQRQPSLQQYREYARKVRDLILRSNIAQQRDGEDQVINPLCSPIGLLPTPKQQRQHDQACQHYRTILLSIETYRKHEHCNGRQFRI